MKKAEKAMRATIAWRIQHAELLAGIRNRTACPPYEALVSRYLVGEVHKQAADGSPIMIARTSVSSPRKLMDWLHEHGTSPMGHELLEYMTFEKEYAFSLCDRETRRTGRLVKMIGIIDFAHVSFWRASDRRFYNLMGKAASFTEDFYPQFLGFNVAVNPPSWFSVVFGIAKLVMPKKTAEKFRVCRGKPSKHPYTACPFFSRLLPADSIPTFLGGKCTCTERGGCIRGVPNDRTTSKMEDPQPEPSDPHMPEDSH